MHTLRVHGKFYYSHNEALQGKKFRFPGRSEKGLRTAGKGYKLSFYCNEAVELEQGVPQADQGLCSSIFLLVSKEEINWIFL